MLTAIGGSMEYEGKFTQGQQGYARLDDSEDGSSEVSFITEAENTTVTVQSPFPEYVPSDQTYEPLLKNEITTAIVDDPDKLDKSAPYKFLWGERYRDYFTKEVTVPVVQLDTLYGGLR